MRFYFFGEPWTSEIRARRRLAATRKEASRERTHRSAPAASILEQMMVEARMVEARSDGLPTVSLLGWRERERYSTAQTRVVGVGTCSCAIHCQLGTESWVIKKFHIGSSHAMIDQIANEVDMLRLSSASPASPNVVMLRDVFETSLGPALCVSQEDCGVSLDRVLAERASGGPASHAASHLTDLCAGVAHLHHRGIVHRDIKPANLAVGPLTRTLKIIDLGSACLLDDVKANAWRGCTCSGGTPLYMPLDALLGAPPKRSHDTWSVGVVGYLLFTGRLPFNAKDAVELRMVVRVGMRGPSRLFEGHAPPLEVAASLQELLSPRIEPSEALQHAHAASAACESVEPLEPASPPFRPRSSDSPTSVTELHRRPPPGPSKLSTEAWTAKLVGDLPQPPPPPQKHLHGFRRSKRVM